MRFRSCCGGLSLEAGTKVAPAFRGHDTEIAGLAAKRIDEMSSTSGGVSWDVAQFKALGEVILSTRTELTVNGTAGEDIFSFVRQTLGAEDHVIGGSGSDQLKLGGDYSAGLVFNGDTLSGVERIVFEAGNSYGITTHDDNVAPGALHASAGLPNLQNLHIA